jgi:hypothetical protein
MTRNILESQTTRNMKIVLIQMELHAGEKRNRYLKTTIKNSIQLNRAQKTINIPITVLIHYAVQVFSRPRMSWEGAAVSRRKRPGKDGRSQHGTCYGVVSSA